MSDCYIIYDWTEHPNGTVLGETEIIVPLTEARGSIAREHLPHEVRVPRIRQLILAGDAEEAFAVSDELKSWCLEQWGPGAVGGVLNPDEARSLDVGGNAYNGSLAKVPFRTDSAWSRMSRFIFRFKDERHAALFKVRAY